MPLVVADRVQETTTTTGTGTVTLAGAVAGFQSFAVIGNGNTTYYCITSGNNWEVGVGTYTSAGTTLARTTVLASSASGAAITLAGTSNVFCVYPATQAVYENESGVVTGYAISGGSINNTPIGATTGSTGAFTTLASTQNATLATTSGNTVSIGTTTLSDKLYIQDVNAGATTTARIFNTGATAGSVACWQTQCGSVSPLQAILASDISQNAGVVGTTTAHDVKIVANNSLKITVGKDTIGAGSVITLQSPLQLASGATSTSGAPIRFATGSILTTPEPGAMEYDGEMLYFTPIASTRTFVPNTQATALATTYTLTSQTAAQKLFNTSTNGAVTLDAGIYQFQCSFRLSSMSTTSGSFGFALGGTATKTEAWVSSAIKNTLATIAAWSHSYNTAANTTLATASTSAVGGALIRGLINVTVAGTLIPQVSLTVAAAAVVQVNSYFMITKISAGTTNFVMGNWS